jgi:hypothetical protein
MGNASQGDQKFGGKIAQLFKVAKTLAEPKNVIISTVIPTTDHALKHLI